MGMGGSSHQGRKKILSEINVTPLVDVMLVLLIIFMITAPLIQQGVKIDLPETDPAQMDSGEDKMILSINKKGQIFLGSSLTPVPKNRLAELVKTNQKLQKDKEIYLHADRSLDYGYILDVMAVLKNSGIESFGMVSEPRK